MKSILLGIIVGAIIVLGVIFLIIWGSGLFWQLIFNDEWTSVWAWIFYGVFVGFIGIVLFLRYAAKTIDYPYRDPYPSYYDGSDTPS